MTFTTLFKLIKAASTIQINGCRVAYFNFKTLRANPGDPASAVAYVEIVGDFKGSVWFRDQVVEVDSDGFCDAHDIADGIPHSFEFRVSRPITKEDLS